MNRMSLLAGTFCILGAACLAVAKQSGRQTPTSPQQRQATDTVRSVAGPADLAYLAQLEQRQDLLTSFLTQGKLKMEQKHYSQAENLFRKALALDNAESEAWLLLADVYERQGKLEEALPAYHRIIYGQGGSIGSDPVTRMRYVLALVRSNRYADAVQVYDKARYDASGSDDAALFPLRFATNNPEESRLQAAAHYVMGLKHPLHCGATPKELRQHLEAAIRLAPDWSKPHAAIAKMLERSWHVQAAEVEYAKARQLGEPVESFKQKYARIEVELLRRHDAAHPELSHTNGAAFSIPMSHEEMARQMDKVYAEKLMTRAQWEVAQKAKIKAQTEPRDRSVYP